MRKRILLFSTSYSPFMSGAEVAIKEITDRLSGDDFSFDMVTLCHDKNLSKYENIGNVGVYRVSSSKLLFPFLGFLKGVMLQRKNKYDIVWSMMAGRNGFAALFFKYTHPRVKFLLTLQEGDRLSYPKERAGVLWFAVGGLFKKIFTKADLIQVISKYLEKWARDIGYTGDIEVVPNGADLNRFKSHESKIANQKLRKELGIEEGEKVIITTSRLVEKNAVEDIIRTLTFLPNNYKLLVAGMGELFHELRKRTDELQLTKRVLFLGVIDHRELPQYLHISDVFVRPSLSEGLGSSFIEAMAAGVPVIATEVGGITDFLKAGVTGLFCGIHDPRGISEKILRLMEDSSLQKHIIKNAHEMVDKKYDWNLITKDMKEKVFDRLEVRKNILITTGIFPPDIGGPATYSKLLLDELPKQGLGVEVLSFGEVRYLPKVVRHIIYVLKILKRGRCTDIIYAQDPVSVGFPSALASFVLRKKFLLKVVGDYAWEQLQVQNGDRGLSSAEQSGEEVSPRSFITPESFQSGKYDFKTEVRRKIERWVAKRAEKIIVPSKYLKKIVSSWKVEENKIQVIHNGIILDNKYGDRDTLRKDFQLDGNIIITTGRLVPWKGFDTLINIFPQIKEKFKNAKLILVGSGPQMNTLQNHVNKKGLENDIVLTGALAKDVLLRYKKASDVFVLNTAYEGLSHHILEAMDVGVPIVTTNVGGNPELIEDEKSGLLIGFNDEKELKEAIIKILNDKKYARTLVTESKRKVQEFSEEKMVNNTAKMLKTL